MMRNNTLNKVHVDTTELPQLLSENTNMFGEATTQIVAVGLRAAVNHNRFTALFPGPLG